MADKLIMTFHISFLPGTDIPYLEDSIGAARIIPFTGSVESSLFIGKILPGAADVQVTNSAGVTHMLAQYMFEGKDYTGTDCRLFVQNNGFFTRGFDLREAGYFEACPSFLTDSKALASYLHNTRFRSEGWPAAGGVDIRVFEIDE